VVISAALIGVFPPAELKRAIVDIAGIVGDTFEEAEIADALLYYQFDRDKTVSWLLDGGQACSALSVID
jgi:hypothetical protein